MYTNLARMFVHMRNRISCRDPYLFEDEPLMRHRHKVLNRIELGRRRVKRSVLRKLQICRFEGWLSNRGASLDFLETGESIDCKREPPVKQFCRRLREIFDSLKISKFLDKFLRSRQVAQTPQNGPSGPQKGRFGGCR